MGMIVGGGEGRDKVLRISGKKKKHIPSTDYNVSKTSGEFGMFQLLG